MKNKSYAFSKWIIILRSVEVRYSLESLLTRQIMVSMIVIALINCWEHLYNWFENLVYAFCIFIGNDFHDQLSFADCPSWTYGPSTELPSLRYRRQLPWLGWAWHRALTQWAVCPLMPWSRHSESLSTLRVVLYLECFNSAYKRIVGGVSLQHYNTTTLL